MKTKIILLLFVYLLAINANAGKPVSYNNPQVVFFGGDGGFYGFSSPFSPDLKFEKVEFTDTATVVLITNLTTPKRQLNFPKPVSLISDKEKRYYIHGYKQDSPTEYRLFFDPLPKTTKYFDFINTVYERNYFGIHDEGYKMDFPKLSSYNTKSEAITNIEEFFKPGIGTLVVHIKRKDRNYLNMSWVHSKIFCGSQAISSLTLDSLVSNKDGVRTYVYHLPVSIPHFSKINEILPAEELVYFLEQGKTTELTFEDNGTISFSENSPMPHLSLLLSVARSPLYFRGDDDDEKYGYLVKRFHLRKDEIHILQNALNNFNEINSKVYIDDEEMDRARIKSSFVNRKLSDYSVLNEWNVNDLSYLMFYTYRYQSLYMTAYDTILLGLYGNSKCELNYDFPKQAELALQTDRQLFGKSEPSALLQLWALNYSGLEYYVRRFREDSTSEFSKKEFPAIIAAERKLLASPQLRKLFEERLEELLKSPVTRPKKVLDVFGDE